MGEKEDIVDIHELLKQVKEPTRLFEDLTDEEIEEKITHAQAKLKKIEKMTDEEYEQAYWKEKVYSGWDAIMYDLLYRDLEREYDKSFSILTRNIDGSTDTIEAWWTSESENIPWIRSDAVKRINVRFQWKPWDAKEFDRFFTS